MATTEELLIVNNAVTSCKTVDDIVKNVRLPRETVLESLEALKALGKINSDAFSEIYCPIGEIAGNISACCDSMVKQLTGGEKDGVSDKTPTTQ